MIVVLVVVMMLGLEDGVFRFCGEGIGEVVVEWGFGVVYYMFVVMEDLVEKLKLFCYEEEFFWKSNLKVLFRYYFVLFINFGE